MLRFFRISHKVRDFDESSIADCNVNAFYKLYEKFIDISLEDAANLRKTSARKSYPLVLENGLGRCRATIYTCEYGCGFAGTRLAALRAATVAGSTVHKE